MPVRRTWIKSPWFSVPLMLVLLLLAWEWVARGLQISELVLPTPDQVAVTFWADLTSGLYWPHLGVTLYESLLGFIFGTLIGALAAALLVRMPALEQMVYPFVVAMQTFPKVAIAPLLITWFGFGMAPKAVLGGLLAFFPVLVNMMVGLKAVPEEQLELLQSLAASEWQIFWTARLPTALPYFFAAIETGIVLTVLGVITGEFVGARKGLGYLVVQKNAVMSIDGVFAVLVLLGLLGVLLHLIVKALHKRVVFWR